MYFTEIVPVRPHIKEVYFTEIVPIRQHIKEVYFTEIVPVLDIYNPINVLETI